jgi:glutathione S-transferase
MVNVDLKDKPQWFLVFDYLEEVYPEPKLSPASPEARAKDRMFLEHFSKVVKKVFSSVF